MRSRLPAVRSVSMVMTSTRMQNRGPTFLEVAERTNCVASGSTRKKLTGTKVGTSTACTSAVLSVLIHHVDRFLPVFSLRYITSLHQTAPKRPWSSADRNSASTTLPLLSPVIQTLLDRITMRERYWAKMASLLLIVEDRTSSFSTTSSYMGRRWRKLQRSLHRQRKERATFKYVLCR